MERKDIGIALVYLVFISGLVGILLHEPVSQDNSYHSFSDQRTMLNVPNFLNVISNIPFMLVGAMGLYGTLVSKTLKIEPELKSAYVMFFIGVVLISIGSGIYHLNPNNVTLVWDRIPMTIGFMALFSVVVGEYISVEKGKLILFPLIILGGMSVAYWHITETNGEGDLRPYILVQFLPMILIPVIILFFRSKFSNTSGYWLLLLFYFLAKLFEHYDDTVYDVGAILSGHSLKHVFVAIGILFLINSYKIRKKT